MLDVWFLYLNWYNHLFIMWAFGLVVGRSLKFYDLFYEPSIANISFPSYRDVANSRILHILTLGLL